MYCPQCGVEYRPGFTECSDCRVALVERPPETDHPLPNMELVTVLEGNNPLTASAAKDLMEQAGIPCYLEGEERSTVLTMVDPNIYRWWRLHVAREFEARARALLDDAISKEDLVIDIDVEPLPLADEQ